MKKTLIRALGPVVVWRYQKHDATSLAAVLEEAFNALSAARLRHSWAEEALLGLRSAHNAVSLLSIPPSAVAEEQRAAFAEHLQRNAQAAMHEAVRAAEVAHRALVLTPAAELMTGLAGPGATRASRKRRSGRPRLSKEAEARRLRLIRDWQRARDAGVFQKEFCADRGVSLTELKRAIDWAGQRARRPRPTGAS